MSSKLNDRNTSRIAIGACLVITAAIATNLTAYKHYGLAGAATSVAGSVCVWFILSRISSPSLLPINARPITLTELFTVLAICVMLYGFSFPDVSSAPRG